MFDQGEISVFMISCLTIYQILHQLPFYVNVPVELVGRVVVYDDSMYYQATDFLTADTN